MKSESKGDNDVGSLSAPPSYTAFAPFYDALLRSDDRDARQAETLAWLFERMNVQSNSRIVDAACGCGGTVAALKTLGYSGVLGCDASQDMLTIARNRYAQLEWHVRRWNELASLFKGAARARAIWALGHSVAHCSDEEFLSVFESMRQSLIAGGICIIDARDWLSLTCNQVLELGRPIGAFRWLGVFEVNGVSYEIEDRCTYVGNRQITDYRVTPVLDRRRTQGFSFSWSTRTANAIAADMEAAGFVEVEILQNPRWPYLLIVGIAV
jgi:SAM-dependent methyltransferase